jgi:hypothetical protein
MRGNRARQVDVIAVVTLAVAGTLFRLLGAADLPNDHYMHMAWAQQLMFGALPGRDFVDPGMPLVYVLSALVQAIRSGPFPEALLTSAMIGVAAAVTYVAAARLSGSRLVGLAAALIELLIAPRLYSYPKVLVPAVAMLLATAYCRRPSTRGLALLGLWTTIATLLRHDLGIDVAVGVVCMLVALHAGRWRTLAAASATYIGAGALTGLPYLLYVAWSEGVAEHLRRAIEFARADAHQRVLLLPEWHGFSGGLTMEDAQAFLYYLAHILPVVILVSVIARRSAGREVRAAAAAAAGILAMYLLVILRYPIAARLPDIASAMALALAGAYGVIAAPWQQQQHRTPVARTLSVVAAGLVAVAIMSASEIGYAPNKLNQTNVGRGVSGLYHRWADLSEHGTVWPWTQYWPDRGLPEVIPYLDACTSSSDALLLTWPAPQYQFFARRPFAGGHAMFLPPAAYTTAQDQAQMVGWLERQSVPIVLINDTRRDEFAKAYGRVDAWISEHYRAVGEFTIYDDSHITIAMRSGLAAAGYWGEAKWPCPRPATASAAASKVASIMLPASATPLPAMSNAVP